MRIMTRIGLPDARPAYVAAATRLGLPVLFSASAFAKPWTREMRDNDEPHPGFRFTRQMGERLKALDCALDSAGYTTMARFGGYVWSVEQYVELAGSHNWSFYSAPDECCEPGVARDRAEVRGRIAATVGLYRQCAAEAEWQGVKPPMPVVQGWFPDDYALCWDHLNLPSAPKLIGIGSMCRRHLHGPVGLAAIVDALDRVIPAGVQFHLFGVKTQGLAALAQHPRIYSTDSQAWAYALRRDHRTGRNNALSVGYIERFAAQQQCAASNTAPAGISGQLPFAPPGAFDRWPPMARAIAADTLEKIETGELDPDCFSSLRILLYVAGRGPAEERATAEALADEILGLDDGLIAAEEPQPDQALAG